MSKEEQYSLDNIQSMNIFEHIRKRPAMYIGRIDTIGNLCIISGLFEYLEKECDWKNASFTYVSESLFQLILNDVLNEELSNEFITKSKFNPFSIKYLLQTIVSLSETCTIISGNTKLEYQKGDIISEEKIDSVSYTKFTFNFDTSILKHAVLPQHLLFNYFERYVMIYPKKEITVFHKEEKVKTFKAKGLLDWYTIKSFEHQPILKPFTFYIENENLHAEIVFSLHQGKKQYTTIVLPRADIISFNGTHAKGFEKGLKAALTEITGNKELFYSLNPIAIFKLDHDAICYHGPTRSKIGNEEFVSVFKEATKKTLLENETFKTNILAFYNT